MPKYRTTTPVFIAPELIPENAVIEFSGTPSITLEPLDDEAQAALDAVYASKPNARINPVDALLTNGGEAGEVGFVNKATVLEVAKPGEQVKTLGNLAKPGKASPGLTEVGGQALDIK